MVVRRIRSDGTIIYTWLLGRELWRLSNLPIDKLLFIAEHQSEEAAGEYAGLSIPPSMLIPVMDRVGRRMMQHAHFKQACVRPQVPRLHIDSPTARHSHTALMFVVCVSEQPRVMLLADGSTIGCKLSHLQTHRKKHIQPLVQRWADLLCLQGKVEHIGESTTPLHTTAFVVVTPLSPPEALHDTSCFKAKSRWVVEDDAEGLVGGEWMMRALAKITTVTPTLAAESELH